MRYIYTYSTTVLLIHLHQGRNCQCRILIKSIYPYNPLHLEIFILFIQLFTFFSQFLAQIFIKLTYVLQKKMHHDRVPFRHASFVRKSCESSFSFSLFLHKMQLTTKSELRRLRSVYEHLTHLLRTNHRYVCNFYKRKLYTLLYRFLVFLDLFFNFFQRFLA